MRKLLFPRSLGQRYDIRGDSGAPEFDLDLPENDTPLRISSADSRFFIIHVRFPVQFAIYRQEAWNQHTRVILEEKSRLP
jgi:hypothetical protein